MQQFESLLIKKISHFKKTLFAFGQGKLVRLSVVFLISNLIVEATKLPTSCNKLICGGGMLAEYTIEPCSFIIHISTLSYRFFNQLHYVPGNVCRFIWWSNEEYGTNWR